jgi:NADPH2 dehydrogenase
VRISADEWEENGWEIKQSIHLCKELEKIGVNAIHVSAGGNIHKPSLTPNIEPLYQVNYAKQIKENIKIPVIAVGLITTAQEAQMLLNNDYCDFVAFGRELLRNPNLPSYIAHEFNIEGVIDKSYLRAFL